MSIKIGNYEIRRYDKLNLEVVETVEKQEMPAGLLAAASVGVRLRPRIKTKEVRVGFYPTLEMACCALMDKDMLDNIDKQDIFSIKNHMELMKYKITESVREAYGKEK